MHVLLEKVGTVGCRCAVAEKSWRIHPILALMLAECRLSLLSQIRQGRAHFRETHFRVS